MEGNFITKQQRSNHAAEIRKTHFKLGDYKPIPEGQRSQSVVNETPIQPLVSLMRASHFALGQDKPTTHSESASRFKQLNVPLTSPYVKPDVSIDLRKTHYVLGNNKDPLTTTAQDFKSCKGETAPISMTSNISRTHHFAYGTDQFKPESTACRDYVGKKIPENAHQEAQKLTKELRKTHFELGNEKPLYATSARSEFQFKTAKYEKANADLQREHFVLGTDKASFQSVSARSYATKEKAKEEFNDERMSDLRKSHFLLGSKPVEYNLTSQDFNGSKAVLQEKIKDSVFRKTNFTLGNATKPSKSIYAMSHSNSAASMTLSTRDRQIDKQSHFNLGNDKAKILSTHQEDFTEFKAQNVKDSKQGEYLRKHHFELGVNNSEFKSMNSNYGKGDAQVAEKDYRLMNDLRSTHFVLGSDQRDMMTMSQKDFMGGKGEKIMSGEKMHGKHAYIDDNGKMSWGTEQKSRFKWIKPVPDTRFKFSFD